MIRLRFYERLWLAVPECIWFALAFTAVVAAFLVHMIPADLLWSAGVPQLLALMFVYAAVSSAGSGHAIAALKLGNAVWNGDIRGVHWGVARCGAASESARALVVDAIRRPEVLAALLRAGVDPNGEPQCLLPLNKACALDSPRSVQLLLDAGAAVNLVAGDGHAPLHCCTSAACAEVLLAHGAALGARSRWGLTPLDVAVKLGRHDVAQVLLAEARWRGWKRAWIASVMSRSFSA